VLNGVFAFILPASRLELVTSNSMKLKLLSMQIMVNILEFQDLIQPLIFKIYLDLRLLSYMLKSCISSDSTEEKKLSARGKNFTFYAFHS